MIKKLANNQLYKTITTILELIITILLIVLIVLTGFQRFSVAGSFFGYRIFTVASGSMIPMYDIGDTLLIKDVPIDDINIGDAVTYQSEVAGVGKVNITHEVVDVEIDETGKYQFHTKGIANDVEDPIVGEEQVVGKVIHRFFFLSLVGYVTTSKVLLLLVIAVPLGVLIAIEVIKLLFGDKSGEQFVKQKLNKKQIKELKDNSRLLSEEEKKKKIAAIRTGTPVTNGKNLTEILKDSYEESINYNALKEDEDLEITKEKLENTMVKDEDKFLNTIKKLKNEYDKEKSSDEEEMDEFLKFVKEKLEDEDRD